MVENAEHFLHIFLVVSGSTSYPNIKITLTAEYESVEESSTTRNVVSAPG